MKKILLALSLFAFAAPAFAGSIVLTSDSDNPNNLGLSETPQEILGILTDNGIALKKLQNGNYFLKARNIHCDYRHRGAYSDETAGIPTEKCRINSENKQDTKKGKVLVDGRALVNVLGKIENAANENVFFTDCAMGYCSTDVKSITCIVDTKVEEFSKGRFSCALVDESAE